MDQTKFFFFTKKGKKNFFSLVVLGFLSFEWKMMVVGPSFLFLTVFDKYVIMYYVHVIQEKGIR